MNNFKQGVIEVPKKRKIKKDIEYEIMDNGCWICISHSLSDNRYPHMRDENGKIVRLNRYMYNRFVGEIPAGMVIRHKCDNTRCINPTHLEIGTQKENIQDMIDRDRVAKGEIKTKTSKLTTKDILEIRESTDTLQKTAEKYNVHNSTICLIKKNKRWQHVL